MGGYASVLYIYQQQEELNEENIGLIHITIKNCEFNHNGSPWGRGVIFIWFDEGYDLYSINLEGNVFKHNSSQKYTPVIEIKNEWNDITPSQKDGEQKISVKIQKNTFENNGSHGVGVVFIEGMPNVEILDDNVFSSNTDAVDFKTKVLPYFIDNGYYIKDYLQQEKYYECWATLYLSD